MAHYIMLTKLTDHGKTTVKNKPSRIKEVNKEVEAMGIEILAQYFLLGPYDFINILQAPDNWSVARLAMELGARGTLDITTMPAMELDDFIKYMEAMGKSSMAD